MISSGVSWNIRLKLSGATMRTASKTPCTASEAINARCSGESLYSTRLTGDSVSACGSGLDRAWIGVGVDVCARACSGTCLIDFGLRLRAIVLHIYR